MRALDGTREHARIPEGLPLAPSVWFTRRRQGPGDRVGECLCFPSMRFNRSRAALADRCSPVVVASDDDSPEGYPCTVRRADGTPGLVMSPELLKCEVDRLGDV
jgi:hypothetical protein